MNETSENKCPHVSDFRGNFPCHSIEYAGGFADGLCQLKFTYIPSLLRVSNTNVLSFIKSFASTEINMCVFFYCLICQHGQLQWLIFLNLTLTLE